jgi:Shikimate kinase
MKPTRIFLVGFMCSGKSTVGKLLADKLGYTFWDIDQVIEEKEGKSIEEIFKSKGEEYFRGLERSVLEEFLEKKDCG